MKTADPLDVANLTANHLRHWAYVRHGLARIRHELELRGEHHDLSKLDPEGELHGFARINATARQHPYGSEEYQASIAAERSTVISHYAANSHHPEHYSDLSTMGWLDIVEMVCDWWSAQQTYGSKRPWADTLRYNIESWAWTPEQRWLIVQVATFLGGAVLEGGVRTGRPGKRGGAR